MLFKMSPNLVTLSLTYILSLYISLHTLYLTQLLSLSHPLIKSRLEQNLVRERERESVCVTCTAGQSVSVSIQ